MKKISYLIGLLLSLLVLGGCASGVARTGPAVSEKFCCTVSNPVGKVEISFTEQGKLSLADNLKFDPEELKDHIERGLVAKTLINKDLSSELPSLNVEIKDVRVRSNFSAVMWGFMAGNDHITGDIIVKDKSGVEMDRFEVSASYALGGLAGGQDSARMGWLYEEFAEQTLNELTKTQ